MIITKETQEGLLEIFRKEGRNNDEIIGFIYGMNAILTYISTKEIEELERKKEKNLESQNKF